MTVKRWIGNAAAVFDIWTIALSGAVTSQAYSITINGKSITYTAGGSDTAATIMTALYNAWTSFTVSPPVEFRELTPVQTTTSTITATAIAPGNPCAISVSATGGATFAATHTQSATGPNDFANVQNWSGGVAPANSDTLVFDNGSVACNYGLSTSLTGVTVIVSPGYSGTIGLPFINAASYAEYRPTSLTLAGGIAQINGPNVRMCNLAFGSNTASVQVTATGQRASPSIPVVLLTGGNSSSALTITKGDVGVACYQGQTAQFNAIQTTFTNSATSDVTLFCGPGAILSSLSLNGGNNTINSNASAITVGVSGGSLTIAAGAVTTLTMDNGTCYYNSAGTLGTATLTGKGTLDFSQDPAAKTVTNPIALYGDQSSVKDPLKLVNGGTLSVTAFQTTQINVNHGAGNVMSFA